MNCQYCHAPLGNNARFCGVCGKAQAATEPVSNPPMDEAAAMIGREIAGRYRILGKLGEGGMGTVYRAEQIALRRAVAIKLLKPDQYDNAMLLRRFNAEAEVVAKLNHPNTVVIYDFGQDRDGSLFIAMELIEGGSLRKLLATTGPLSVPRALGIAVQIAASIADAHAHKVIHRDLKPDNVMLQDRGRQRDVVRVLDFGIAKLRTDGRATAPPPMTQAGDMLGTPYYMSPEQILGEPVDGRADVYALGCVVYEMVTGRMPFEAPTMVALLAKHLQELPMPPSARRPDLGLPPELDALVMSAVAKDRNARPATMELMGEQLAALLASLPADTLPAGTTGSGPRPRDAMAATAPVVPLAAPTLSTGPGAPGPPVAPTAMIARPGSPKTPLWIGLGLLVAGAIGAASYQSMHRSHPNGAPAPGSTQPDHLPGADSPELAYGMYGIRMVVPPGYRVITNNAQQVTIANGDNSIGITMYPLDTSSADPTVTASHYAALKNYQIVRFVDVRSMADTHKAALFDGAINGISIRELIVAYPGATPIAIAITAVRPLWDQPPFNDWVDSYLANCLVYP